MAEELPLSPRDRHGWVAFSQPVDLAILQKAERLVLNRCGCGGPARILLLSHRHEWCEIECTQCAVRTVMTETLGQAARVWNAAHPVVRVV